MSLQTLTVTAVAAFPTKSISHGINGGHDRSRPDDLIVTSVRRVNSTLPFLLTAAMAIGLIIADWSLHLPWEYRLLRTRSRWKLSHLAYFCSRIGGIAFALSAVLHHFVGNLNPGPEELGRERWDYADSACSAVKKAYHFFSFLSLGGSTAILLLRCLALWRFNRAVLLPLSLLWITTPVLVFVNIFNLSSKSQDNGLSACQNLPPRLHAHPVLSYMPWFVLPVFDSAILIFSLLGLRRATARRNASDLERMFRFDNIFYYVVTLLMVLPIPIYYLAEGKDGRMMPYNNLYIGLSSVLSCRIFINLWKAIGQELALAHTFSQSRNPGPNETFDGYSSQRRTHGATSLGVPTVELRTQRSTLSRRSQNLGEDVVDDESDLPATDSDGHEASTSSDNKDLSDAEEKGNHHDLVPHWSDVDPDLAFSLRGAQLLDEKDGPGLQSSP